MKYQNLLAPYIFWYGLILIAIGLPFSTFLMSVGHFVLAAGWLLQGDYSQRIKKFFKNPAALILSSIFFLHILGLAWTDNFVYASNDIRIKLPLFLLPFLFISGPPLPEKIFQLVIKLFVAATALASFISAGAMFGFYTDVTDIREASIFISHIRFSLMVCLSIVILVYYLLLEEEKKIKLLYLLLILWMMLFLGFLQSLTGLGILLALSILLLLFILNKIKHQQTKYLLIIPILLFSAAFGFYFFKISKEEIGCKMPAPESLASHTANGNLYDHNTSLPEFENCNPIWIYICQEELESSWNDRSRISYDGFDAKGQYLQYTLIRYLTSKGLRKDSTGVFTLTTSDIEEIENGIANYKYRNLGNLQTRVKQMFWEFRQYTVTGNPSGHSIMQRLEFFKTAISIIKKNFFIGVGTGDINDHFLQTYEEQKTTLLPERRLRAHNQYLTFFAIFGIIGFLWFIFSLIFPLIFLRKYSSFLYLSFFVIAALSMLTEDTLETQAGVTFFAFFNSLFVFYDSDSRNKTS